MLSEVLGVVARVTGEMALASVRGRASRTQISDWAARLHAAADRLERTVRGD